VADRLAAIGGTLDIESGPGSGTNVQGVIPLTVTVQVGASISEAGPVPV